MHSAELSFEILLDLGAAHMAADSQRFFGPVLSSAEHESVFAGSDEKERMALVRKQIFKIRSKWTVTEEYDKLRETVRKYVRPEIQPKNLRIQMNRLLQGYHDYADTDYERPSRTAPEDYSALELYCSKEGYEYVFSLISQTLRIKEVSPEILVTAVTLVEYLTIDLYNLRLSNLGDLRYANYQGIIHRGLCVTSKALEDYREVANRKDIVKRNFSIPLAFMSSTTDLKVMERFSQQTEAADLHRMHWTIHVHGVDPDLLNAYLKAYPDSIVTSICAMPVARLSPFGEKEVLLRGAFFQIINMQSDEVKGYTVHKLEVAMMNANRDHVTELGSNEGVKELQREFFHQIVAASKYEVCAALAARYSMSDAEAYRSLQQEKLDRIRELSGVDVVRNTGLASARSGEVAVWLGGSLFSSYSRHYANLRRSWQEAVTSGTWSDGEKVLSREYEWRRGEWFNIGKLSGESFHTICECFDAQQ